MNYQAWVGFQTFATRSRVGRSARRGTLWLAVAALTGCDFLNGLIDVEAPARIDAAVYEQPGNAQILLAGALGDFQCAFSHYIVANSLVGEEFALVGGGSAWTSYDQRTMDPAGALFLGAYAENTCDSGGQRAPAVFQSLSTAQYQTNHLRVLLNGWTDAEVANRTSLIASAAAYAGYATLLMGEAMCTAAFELGPELTSAQVFARAEERFTEALSAAQTANIPTIRNMALVGRARARLNLGRKADAAADAVLVPAGFVFTSTYSSVSLRRENTVFVNNIRDNFISIGELYRDVRFQGVLDPRVGLLDTGRQSTTIPGPAGRIFVTTKYPAATSPIPLAKWEEAQLIIAENHVATGNLPAAVAIINQLHAATTPALPAFSSSNAAEIMSQIIAERRAALFLESHHLGDMRRYQIPLRPAAGSPYPLLGTYGDRSCFPLPDIERLNNPNIG